VSHGRVWVRYCKYGYGRWFSSGLVREVTLLVDVQMLRDVGLAFKRMILGGTAGSGAECAGRKARFGS
jgi:hypothetical protein